MGREAAGHSQAARGWVCERAAAGVEGERVLGTGQESRVDEGSQGEGAGGAEGRDPHLLTVTVSNTSSARPTKPTAGHPDAQVGRV